MARIGFALLALVLFCIASVAAAADVKGKVIALDRDKRTISVNADDKDQTFDINESVKVYRHVGNNIKRAGYEEAPGGKDLAVDALVTISTDFIDGKEQATRIKIESSPGKASKRSKENSPSPTEPKTTTDVDGSITALDGKRLLMTLAVDGKPQKFTVSKECHVLAAVKTGKKKTRYDVSPNGLADITVGLDVTITVDSQTGKDLVTMVKINNPPAIGDAKPTK